MFPSRRPTPRLRDTAMLSGWVFADLLLALAVIFLASSNNSVAFNLHPARTPIVTPSPTPAPTQIPHLETTYQSITITVNTTALLNNDPQTVANFQQQMVEQPLLQHRRVGLAIVYGIANSVAPEQTSQANQISSTVIAILKGINNPIFAGTSYYHPVIDIDPTKDVNSVELDVFLFALS